jgi:hypothetical protein
MKIRVLLVSLGGLLAVACYAWLHIRYVIMAIPVAHDIPFVLFHTLLPVMLLALLVGALMLWSRTRHVAALLQLVSCCLIFVLAVVEEVGKVLDHADKSQLSEFMLQPAPRFAGQIVVFLCFIAFLTGYIWYARTIKRI